MKYNIVKLALNTSGHLYPPC